jgi:hypothetical protein
LEANKKEAILDLFWRTELYPGEKIIDNGTSFIAKKLGLTSGYVSEVIERDLKDRWRIINNK